MRGGNYWMMRVGVVSSGMCWQVRAKIGKDKEIMWFQLQQWH